MNSFDKFDYKTSEIPSPCYVVEEELLHRNLQLIKSVSERSGAEIIMAFKAFAIWKLFDITRQYIPHSTASSLSEARLAFEKLGSKAHTFAPVYKDSEIETIAQCSSHITFNSLAQFNRHKGVAEKYGISCGVRINPEYSDVETDLYNPCAPGSRFGIIRDQLPEVLPTGIEGLHFHIGSQITNMDDFRGLCLRINELQEQLDANGLRAEMINVGGGLGVDYHQPQQNPIPDFHAYFQTYATYLQLREGQTLHFELGRAIVAQCGTLVTRVLYVKQGVNKQFVIVDAGMTELIRPALYHAHHAIENLTSTHTTSAVYDVVGPICESSDVFDKDLQLPLTERGDLLAIRSAGAYGETMASCYNCRPLPNSYTDKEISL